MNRGMEVKVKHKGEDNCTVYSKDYYKGYVTAVLDRVTKDLNLRYHSYFSETTESVYVLVYEKPDKYKVMCIRGHSRKDRIRGKIIDLESITGLNRLDYKIFKYLQENFKVDRGALDVFTESHYNAMVYLSDRMFQGLYFTCTKQSFFSNFENGLYEGFPDSMTFEIKDQNLLDSIVDLKERGLIQGFSHDKIEYNLYLTNIGKEAFRVLGEKYTTRVKVHS